MRIQGVEVTESHIYSSVFYLPKFIPCTIIGIIGDFIQIEPDRDKYNIPLDSKFPSLVSPHKLVWRSEQFGSDLYHQEIKDSETKKAVSSFKIANEGHWDHRPENSRTIKDSIKHTITNPPDLKPELTITTENSYPYAIPTVPTPSYQTANSTFNPYKHENQVSNKIHINNHGSDGLGLKLPNHEITLQNVPNIPYQGLIFNGTPPMESYKIGTNQNDADPVNKPTHYNFSDIEPIKVIEAWNLGFHLGNCLKYLARAKHKGNELQDLKKARYYLDRQIDLLEKK